MDYVLHLQSQAQSTENTLLSHCSINKDANASNVVDPDGNKDVNSDLSTTCLDLSATHKRLYLSYSTNKLCVLLSLSC